MLLDIVYILLKSVSSPSIIFMIPIFLATIDASSHLVHQVNLHMVYFLGVVVCWSGVVLIVGSSMIPALVILFVAPILLVGCRFLIFIWAYSVCSCFESTNIASCALVGISESVKLMLVGFPISFLS